MRCECQRTVRGGQTCLRVRRVIVGDAEAIEVIYVWVEGP